MTKQHNTAAPCRGKCVGGGKCTCNAGHKTHHICADPLCVCHSAAAYGLERVTVRGAVEYRRVERLGVRE